MLSWSSHDDMVGTLCAVGARGIYSVQRVGNEWVLQGVGHDSLPMSALPLQGKPFQTLTSAQTYAQELDRRAPVESQVGSE